MFIEYAELVHDGSLFPKRAVAIAMRDAALANFIWKQIKSRACDGFVGQITLDMESISRAERAIRLLRQYNYEAKDLGYKSMRVLVDFN